MPKSNKITLKQNKKTNQKVYLDYAGSVEPNASSIHFLGLEAKNKLNVARSEVAKILNVRPNEIIFTSGGTESNNLAIQGIIYGFVFQDQISKNKKIIPHIVTTNIEHPSVLETFKMLEKRGLIEMSVVPVEANGIVESKNIKKALKINTLLVSVMYANNEIGTIQPLREIAKEIRHYKKTNNIQNLFFHTDAVQGANYLDLNIESLGVDLLSLSGAKIEESGKVGLLYKKNSVIFSKIYGGGDQEKGVRPGTENVSEITKFAKGLALTQKIKETENKRLSILRDYFFKKLLDLSKQSLGEGLLINGDLINRLANNVNITIQNIPSDLLVIELSQRGVYASSKSACKEGDGKVSYVIEAINPKIKETDGSLRFSFGRKTKKEDIEYVVKSLKDILSKLKKWYT
jgi:cysteine desulfurase